MNGGGEARFYNIADLQNRISIIRQHNTGLEDQLAGSRVQILALQGELDDMRKGRDKSALQQHSNNSLALSEQLAEYTEVIAALRHKLAERDEREKQRVISSVAEREQQYHNQLEQQRQFQAKQASLNAEEVKLKVQHEQIKSEEEMSKQLEQNVKDMEASLVEKKRQREERDNESKAKRGECLMRKIIGRMTCAKISSAFAGWLQNSQDSTCSHRIGLRAIARLKHRMAVLSFSSWADAACTLKTQRAKVMPERNRGKVCSFYVCIKKRVVSKG